MAGGAETKTADRTQDTELIFDFNTLKAFSLKILPKHQDKYLFKTKS